MWSLTDYEMLSTKEGPSEIWFMEANHKHKKSVMFISQNQLYNLKFKKTKKQIIQTAIHYKETGDEFSDLDKNTLKNESNSDENSVSGELEK